MSSRYRSSLRYFHSPVGLKERSAHPESTRSEARRAVEQGGVTFADEKVTDVKATYTKETFKDGVMVKKGKKSFKKVTA